MCLTNWACLIPMPPIHPAEKSPCRTSGLSRFSWIADKREVRAGGTGLVAQCPDCRRPTWSSASHIRAWGVRQLGQSQPDAVDGIVVRRTSPQFHAPVESRGRNTSNPSGSCSLQAMPNLPSVSPCMPSSKRGAGSSVFVDGECAPPGAARADVFWAPASIGHLLEERHDYISPCRDRWRCRLLRRGRGWTVNLSIADDPDSAAGVGLR